MMRIKRKARSYLLASVFIYSELTTLIKRKTNMREGTKKPGNQGEDYVNIVVMGHEKEFTYNGVVRTYEIEKKDFDEVLHMGVLLHPTVLINKDCKQEGIVINRWFVRGGVKLENLPLLPETSNV
ncbi:MAG: hypothetical protein F6J92_32235 [Symploca sp. SIO1A3]|nr:hypothetical protein [Symploca sp. SIO1A3]